MPVCHDYDWLFPVALRNRFWWLTRGGARHPPSAAPPLAPPLLNRKRLWSVSLATLLICSRAKRFLFSSTQPRRDSHRKPGAPNQSPGKACARRTKNPETCTKAQKRNRIRLFTYYIRPVALAALRAAWATSISNIRESKIHESKIRETKTREINIMKLKSVNLNPWN